MEAALTFVPEWFRLREGESAHLAASYILHSQLLELVGEIAQLLFFLLGAMVIVELVDAHEGFAVITRHVKTSSTTKLLWIIGWLTFFMSSVLDNLTTTIVMVSLLRKLVPERSLRLYFVGLVVIAANAGGAWTPIGDVTTTMLWMDGKFTPSQVVFGLFAPSAVCLLVPLLGFSALMGRAAKAAPAAAANTQVTPAANGESELGITRARQLTFFGLGVGGLLAVPVFKALTGLPPFMGMLGSLSAIWIAAELTDGYRPRRSKSSTGVVDVLRRIDMPSLLFFLGILLAVGALGSAGLLVELSGLVDSAFDNQLVVAVLIGLASAVIDNVPLVAAGMDMYSFADGHDFWLALAYCAGTGGSCLIIGSAAGVAAMGLENIDFIWYFERIAPLALLGYLAGVAVYVLTLGGV